MLKPLLEVAQPEHMETSAAKKQLRNAGKVALGQLMLKGDESS